jgi:acyl carrier protein
MELDLIKQKVNEIIYEVLKERIEYKDITPDKHLIEGLGADSSETLEIFLDIMSDFNIEINRNDLVKLDNLDAFYKYIQTLVNANEKS